MACPNGSEPKPGYSGFVWMDSQLGLDECQGPNKPWYCSFVGAVTSWGEDVETLCAGSPPAADDYRFLPNHFKLDQVATKIANFTAWARARNWNKYCQCKKPPDEPPPFNGGQCENVAYEVIYATSGGYESRYRIYVYGPVKGFRQEGINCHDGINAYLSFKGRCGPPPLNSSQEERIFSCGFQESRLKTTVEIISVTRVDGRVDDCGDLPPNQFPRPDNDPVIPPPLPPGLPEPPQLPPPDCSNCPPGPKGDRGEPGQRGEQGVPGQRGERGERGESGQRGERGEKGDRGEQGIQGREGPEGRKGEPGPEGKEGLPGRDGVAGLVGPAGAAGTAGPAGADGRDGRDGRDGEDAEVEFEELEIPWWYCNNGRVVKDKIKIQIIKGTAERELFHFRQIAALKELECNREASVLAIPEWWQVRPEYQRPQLLMIFREHDDAERIIGSPWQVTIPHPNLLAAPVQSPIPAYHKGDWELIWALKDNSKLILHCISRKECERIFQFCKAIIKPDYWGALGPKIGERVASPLQEKFVYPRQASYYSHGLKNTNPDWIAYF